MVKYAQYRQLITKAHTDSMKELHKDPIKWGVENKQIDPIRFDTSENFAHSIAQRPSFVAKVKQVHGITTPHISKEEGRPLKDQLMRSPSHETVQKYQDAYQLLTDKDKDAMETAFEKKKDDHVLASVVLLSTREGQPMAAQRIVIGAKNRLEVEKAFKADLKSDNKSFDSHYNRLIAHHLAPLHHNSVSGYSDRTSDAVKLYIMGTMKPTGDYTLNHRVVEDGIKQVLGNVPISVNHSIVMPPRGMEKEEFLDRLWIATKSTGEFNPYWSHYMNVGGGRYALMEHGNPKVDEDGNPIIINLRDVPVNKLMEANEERKREEFKNLGVASV